MQLFSSLTAVPTNAARSHHNFLARFDLGGTTRDAGCIKSASAAQFGCRRGVPATARRLGRRRPLGLDTHRCMRILLSLHDGGCPTVFQRIARSWPPAPACKLRNRNAFRNA